VSPEAVFTTERLVVRPWALEDAMAFHRIWGDPEVIWWGNWTKDLEASRALLADLIAKSATMPEGQGWFAVALREGGEVVANLVLRPPPYEVGTEIGYHVVRAHWGLGIATEAARGLVGHAHGALAIEHLSAVVHVDNARSQRVIRNAGFVRTRSLTYANLPHDLFERHG